MKTILLFANCLFFFLLLKNNFASEKHCDTSKIFNKFIVLCTETNCPRDSIVTTYQDGILSRKKTFWACKDSGEYLYFSDHGDTLTQSLFRGKKTIGVFKEWYKNDKLKSRIHYNDSGQKHGLSETWREDGTRKDSTVFENGKFVVARQYFLDGKINTISKFKDGKFWEITSFSPEGDTVGFVTNGTGLDSGYAADGKSRYITKYRDGEFISMKKMLGKEELLAKKAKEAEVEKQTALANPGLRALQANNLKLLKSLLEKGLNPNFLFRNDSIAYTDDICLMHVGALTGNKKALLLMKKYGGSFGAQSSNCATPYEYAYHGEHYDLIKMFLKKEKYPQRREKCYRGYSGYHDVVIEQDNIEMFKLLAENGFDPLVKDRLWRTTFEIAVLKSSLNILKYLFKNYSYTLVKDDDGLNIFHIAAIADSGAQMCEFLIEEGVDPKGLCQTHHEKGRPVERLLNKIENYENRFKESKSAKDSVLIGIYRNNYLTFKKYTDKYCKE